MVFHASGAVVALLARSKPVAVPVAALLYAYLLVGADRMDMQVQVGREVVYVIQAVIVLLVAVPFIRGWLPVRLRRAA